MCDPLPQSLVHQCGLTEGKRNPTLRCARSVGRVLLIAFNVNISICHLFLCRSHLRVCYSRIFSCISRNTLKHWRALHLNMASLHISPDWWWNSHIRALRWIRARAPVWGGWTANSVLCQCYACRPVQSTSLIRTSHKPTFHYLAWLCLNTRGGLITCL